MLNTQIRERDLKEFRGPTPKLGEQWHSRVSKEQSRLECNATAVELSMELCDTAKPLFLKHPTYTACKQALYAVSARLRLTMGIANTTEHRQTAHSRTDLLPLRFPPYHSSAVPDVISTDTVQTGPAAPCHGFHSNNQLEAGNS